VIGNLSATMVSAIDLALESGGELVRYQGGYWAARGKPHPSFGQTECYGTKTIEALVARGCAEYSEHRDGRNGRFPVAVKLTPKVDA